MKHNFKRHCFPEPERYKRQGFPEAVYGPGKTVDQIVSMAKGLMQGSGPVIVTRVEEDIFRQLSERLPGIEYNKTAKIVIIKKVKSKPVSKSYACVITAGTSDIPVAEEARVVAELLGTRVKAAYDIGVSGIHRLFSFQKEISKASCIVVCAGMEGALASVVGGLAKCPVIAVPTSVGYGVSFKGVSALLTMLNSCAPNVSVVNIDDGFGAGVIASLICKKKR